MTRLILPGWHGSDAGHWQQLWLDADPHARWVEQADWKAPELDVWLGRLHQAVLDHPGAILIAHSLGAILAVHYAARHPDADIAGAFLVAPPDIDALPSDHVLHSFAPAPLDRLPFPSVLALSANNSYLPLSRGHCLARHWGSDPWNSARLAISTSRAATAPGRTGFAWRRGSIRGSPRSRPRSPRRSSLRRGSGLRHSGIIDATADVASVMTTPAMFR